MISVEPVWSPAPMGPIRGATPWRSDTAADIEWPEPGGSTWADQTQTWADTTSTWADLN